MSNPTRAPVQTPFPFMKLATELRLQIYRELLQAKNDLRMSTSRGFYRNHLHPNILQTCHQVYDEAVEVLYGENIFHVDHVNPDNPNASRVKRGRAYVFEDISRLGQYNTDRYHVETLTRFLHDHPDMTHLFLSFGRWDIEVQTVQTGIENALRGHNGMINLEVRVHSPLTPQSIAFCWRLHSIVKRNRSQDGVRPEEAYHDAATCPPFVKCTHVGERPAYIDKFIL